MEEDIAIERYYQLVQDTTAEVNIDLLDMQRRALRKVIEGARPPGTFGGSVRLVPTEVEDLKGLENLLDAIYDAVLDYGHVRIEEMEEDS